jgi:ABC-type amino acid transport substrate-binding protein
MRYGWLVVAAVVSVSSTVMADPPQVQPAPALRHLTIGVEDQAYLPAYAYEKGQYHGAVADIFAAFAKDEGYEITYKPLPIRRLYVEVFRGDVDLKFPDSPDWMPELRSHYTVTYSNPIIRYVDGVMVRPAMKDAPVDQIKSLGTVQGFTLMSELRARVDAGQCELRENPRFDQLLRQVIVGRVDGAYASVAGAHYVLSHDLGQPNGLVYDSKLPHRTGAYLLSSVSHPEVVAAFNDWMGRNHSAVAAILKKWDAEAGVDGP